MEFCLFFKRQIQLAKINYEKRKFVNKKNNPKEFFAYIDSKTKAKNSIPTLQLDGLTLDNDRAKAHAFISQFSSV